MECDPIAIIETLYRTDVPSSTWLADAMRAMQPLMDPGHQGVFGGFYNCPDPLSFVPEQVLAHEVSDPLLAIFEEGLQDLSEEFVGGTFLCNGVVRVSQVDGWNKIPPVRDGALRAQGLVDNRSLVAIEPDGTGCCLASFHAEPVVFRKEEGHLLRGLFRHFGAAHRLQRKRGGGAALPDLADAVLDSAGRLHHVRGAAGEPALRGALRAAVLATEESRGRRRREDPHGALSAWECLVAGRWTFVDHFDHDGRRYVLALENSVRPPAFDLLSPRERDVVEHALRGSDNKVIAYDLGIAHATVKVLMTRAAAKLGVRTRRELLAKMKAHLVRR